MTAQGGPTLGLLMRSLRARFGLTLKEMSERTGVPFSTLSKVEHDRLTLTFDKLQTISERLDLPMSEMLSSAQDVPVTANSRLSVATLAAALHVTTPNYDYFYLSPELRHKKMIPIFTRVKARSLREFGEMVRHDGQEFVYVLQGCVAVHTEFYEPVTLRAGEAIYIDSKMGHAYVVADDADCAQIICLCSATQEELLDNAARQEQSRKPAPRSSNATAPSRARRRASSRASTARRDVKPQ